MGKNIDKIFVFLHDGYYGLQSGAGKENKRLLKCLEILGLGQKSILCPIKVTPDSDAFHQDIFEESEALRLSMGAGLIPVTNNSGAIKNYGTIEHWKYASADALRIIEQNTDRSEQVFVISIDTPFVSLCELLAKDNVRHLHIPHSTGLLHMPDHHERIDLERSAYTREAKGLKVGSIGKFMRDHLKNDYGVKPKHIQDIFNGVIPGEFKKVARDSVETTIEEYGIGLDRPFILAYGRSQPYKGFHILLEALSLVKGERPQLLLMLAGKDHNEEYARHLEKLWQDFGIKGVMVDKFSDKDIEIIKQSPQLLAIVVPSLSEPFGLIPLETFGNQFCNAIVVSSNVGGLEEQVNDQTGISYNALDAAQLANALQRIMDLSQEEIAAYKLRSYSHIQTHYNYPQNIERALEL